MLLTAPLIADCCCCSIAVKIRHLLAVKIEGYIAGYMAG
jgi:hypothetical protein